MKHIHLFILLFASSCIFANNSYEQGNQAYTDGQYADAVQLYSSALDSIGPNAELYYNLANAYYRQNELGLAILNYERALTIKPLYKDAKYNLAIAQERIVDNVADNQSLFLSNWINTLMHLFKAHTWMWISIILFLITLVGLFVYFFSKALIARKIGFHTAWICLLFSIISLIFCLASQKQANERRDAIITAGVISVKASPDRSGTELFLLHEGTKVKITDSITDWDEIEVGNNKGWLPSKALERI